MAFTPVARQPHSSVIAIQRADQCSARYARISFVAKRVALMAVAIFAAYALICALKAVALIELLPVGIAICFGAATFNTIRKFVSRWFEYCDEDIQRQEKY